MLRFWLDPESWIDYWDDFIDVDSADEFLRWALDNVDWQDRGDSRRVAWYGAFEYQYPGVSHPPQPMPAELQKMCDLIKTLYPDDAAYGFDGVRLNRYDAATSFVDFHADDEPSLAFEYPLAFLSFGRPRTLLFRATSHTVHPGYSYQLGHASLLVLGGATQSHWHHGVPVEPQSVGTRISITLRKGSHDFPDDQYSRTAIGE